MAFYLQNPCGVFLNRKRVVGLKREICMNLMRLSTASLLIAQKGHRVIDMRLRLSA